ncbi:unnamed protein product [Phytophthora fragariaefolia]|uniref:Unnamed protein product n=1 Tax=Phytophthora fragariaefolia TaxID=1490495 RepID=A0A9W7CWZ2_9STRA|nr:unnamed protein product [Phytophthora fragariaefolia]
MKPRVYRPIGTTYIIGRVYRLVKKGKKAIIFQIRWLDSQFQSAVEHIRVGVVQLGIKHYVALIQVKNPDWRVLVQPDPTDDIDFEEENSDCDEEEVLEVFDPTELLPTSLAEVEAIRSIRLFRLEMLKHLHELVIILGILFFTSMNDRGEYAIYWGLQAEDLIFGGATSSLDGFMTLHPFKATAVMLKL